MTGKRLDRPKFLPALGTRRRGLRRRRIRLLAKLSLGSDGGGGVVSDSGPLLARVMAAALGGDHSEIKWKSEVVQWSSGASVTGNGEGVDICIHDEERERDREKEKNEGAEIEECNNGGGIWIL